ncbi:hypothetical protein [Streptomyces sp. H27-C3]|uniref:hypothetical protein n=1 Tax=Streptomyces sp. H27-C3 TaxID=3046305 RepID=UPI0024B94EAC|nr:hypothetical protein [Streptomyces sp. H27-C3]MDJ0461578.1 hypothetical protein [Streptomyces sp. H27-C3]
MSTPEIVLSDDTRTLLGLLADKLDSHRPTAVMHNATRLALALVFAEQLHGPSEKAFTAEQDLLAAAPPVRPEQTRGEYATLLRLLAQGVSAR